MKKSVFEKIIEQTPNIVAIFKVKVVPDWTFDLVKVGDEVYYEDFSDLTARVLGTEKRIKLGTTYIDFVGYRQI